MITLEQAEDVRRRVERDHKGKDLGLLGQMPSALRRMGLVRAIEWLGAGKQNRSLGQLVHQHTAPLLQLDPDIGKAVEQLETCSRTELFETHRRAVALFDHLATLQKIAGGS